MSLLDAPAYDERRANLHRNLLIAGSGLFALLVVLAFAGFITGHGWLYSNLPVEHKVDRFLSDIEKSDFAGAYGIYVNDKNWQGSPEKYGAYPLDRFTADWTTFSPVGPIRSHHVDKSVTDGTGLFGTTVIVAATVNGSKRLFIPYQRSDGTLTYPAPHIFSY